MQNIIIIIIIIFKMNDHSSQQKVVLSAVLLHISKALLGRSWIDLWKLCWLVLSPWSSQCHPPPQTEASPDTEVEELRPPAPPVSGRPLSPRQRRAQQHSQQGQRNSRDPASRPAFAPAPRQPQDESSAGSAVLIVLLTLALAALIFRRIYLAQEYELWP